MFLLHFLPDALLSWVVNGLLVVGIIGTAASWIARFVPIVSQYRGPIQIVGIVCLVLGVYFKGGEASELAWRERVAEQQRRIELAEAKSKEANRLLDEEIKKSKQLTEKVKDATKQSIQANAKQIDAECRVPDVAIELHNSSSRNEIPRSAGGTTKALPAAGTSSVK